MDGKELLLSQSNIGEKRKKGMNRNQNNIDEQGERKHKKRKIKKKFKRILLVLIVVAIVATIIVGLIMSQNKGSEDKDTLKDLEEINSLNNSVANMNDIAKEIDESDIAKEISKSNEEFLKETSWINGYTWGDLKEMGLSLYKNADSDCDGLNDKDEMLKYHTDPLSINTSGDLYNDGDAVANGLNPTEVNDGIPNWYHGVNTDTTIPVEATIDTSKDLYAKVVEIDKVAGATINGEKIVYGFTIESSGTTLSFNLQSVLDETDGSDINVYKLNYGALGDECSDWSNIDSITPVESEFDNNELRFKAYTADYIFCCKEESQKGFNLFGHKQNDDIIHYAQSTIDDEKEKNDKYQDPYMLITCITLSDKPNVYYVPGSDEKANKTMFKEMAAIMDEVYDYCSADTLRKDYSFEEVSYTKYLEKISDLELLSLFEITDTEWNPQNLVGFFIIYKNIENRTYKYSDELSEEDAQARFETVKIFDPKYVSQTSGFDSTKDEFPFGNFSTILSTEMTSGGVCAGISALTRKSYNNENIIDDDKFQYISPNGENDEEMTETYDWFKFFNYNLKNTKTKKKLKAGKLNSINYDGFVNAKEHYETINSQKVLNKNLSHEEIQLRNFIRDEWSKENTLLKTSRHNIVTGGKNIDTKSKYYNYMYDGFYHTNCQFEIKEKTSWLSSDVETTASVQKVEPNTYDVQYNWLNAGVLEEVEKILDSGKIVSCAFNTVKRKNLSNPVEKTYTLNSLKDPITCRYSTVAERDGYHEVNIIDYREYMAKQLDKGTSARIFVFTVYDSNFPGLTYQITFYAEKEYAGYKFNDWYVGGYSFGTERAADAQSSEVLQAWLKNNAPSMSDLGESYLIFSDSDGIIGEEYYINRKGIIPLPFCIGIEME